MSIRVKLRWFNFLLLLALAPWSRADEPAQAVPAESSLTPQVLYQFLLAEIAANRGNLPASAAAYLDLARTTRDARIARRATEVAYYSHQPEAALAAARVWADIAPQAEEGRQALWGLLAASNRYDELALAVAGAFAGAGPGIGQAILSFGRQAIRYPDKQAAQRLLTVVTSPYESLPETHFVRAQAAHAAHDADLALSSINRALAIKPDWEAAVLVKAQLVSADPAASLQVLGEFLARNPAAGEAKLIHARILVDTKRYAEARKEFEELLAVQPDRYELLYSMGLLSLQLNDLPAGERYLKRLLGTDFADLDSVRYYLGHGAETGRRWDAAVGYFDTVTPGSARYVSAQIRAADILRQQGRTDVARARLQQAALSAPGERTEFVLAESRLLVDAKQDQAAYDVLAAALVDAPDNPTLLYEAAMLAERLQRYEVLDRNLGKLIQLKPDNPDAYNALGYSLADRNVRLAEAQTLIEKAVALSPQNGAILDSRGWVAYRRGDSAGAVEFLRRAFALSPDPEIAAHLGEVLWAMGQQDEARKTWNEARKAHPDNAPLAATIRRFQP